MMREQYSAVEYEINISKPTSASPYDQSFFYKNKILSKFTFRINRKHFFNMEFIPFIFNFDIMIVDDEMPVENVAKNFDLSFCELWYDGINLHSNSNIDDILAKKGILKPDYVNSLLQYRNKFIHDRIMKYMKRGYKISYDYDNTVTCKLPQKHLIDETDDQWVISKLLPLLYRNFNSSYRIYIDSLQYKKFDEFYNFVLENYDENIDIPEYKFNNIDTQIEIFLEFINNNNANANYKNKYINVLRKYGIIVPELNTDIFEESDNDYIIPI